MLNALDIKIILTNKRNLFFFFMNAFIFFVCTFLSSDLSRYISYYYIKIFNWFIINLMILAQTGNYFNYTNINTYVRFKRGVDLYKKILFCDLFILVIFWILNVVLNLGLIAIYGCSEPELLSGYFLFMFVWPLFMTTMKHVLFLKTHNYNKANIICIASEVFIFIVDLYFGILFTSLRWALVALNVSVVLNLVMMYRIKQNENLVRDFYEK